MRFGNTEWYIYASVFLYCKIVCARATENLHGNSNEIITTEIEKEKKKNEKKIVPRGTWEEDELFRSKERGLFGRHGCHVELRLLETRSTSQGVCKER